MKISVCIPTYEMEGKGTMYLESLFQTLQMQTCRDFEVVVSDHSVGKDIEGLCESKDLDINYIRNKEKRGSSSANLNNALMNAKGEIIKILFQDDYLCDSSALELIYESFDEDTFWVVNGSVHTHDDIDFFNPIIPRYNSNIHLGNNTISSPSVLAIRNEEVFKFDENLLWLMDVEYYKRLYDEYGLPQVIERFLVVNRLWEGQISNCKITQDIIDKEVAYITDKYS